MNELVIDFNYEFSLYGIVSSLKEFQVAYYVNKLFHTDLMKSDDYLMDFASKGSLVFSVFESECDSLYIRLIKNKAVEVSKMKKPLFLPELKEYDYFLQVEGGQEDWYADELEDLLKAMTQFQYVKQFDVENIESKENLIY